MAAKFPNVRIYAYMDDVTLTAHDPKELTAAFLWFRDQCRPLGLEFNAKKCEWFGGPVPEELAVEGVLHAGGCIKILGAYIGDIEAIRTKLLAKLDKHDVLFQRLKKMGPGSAQYAMLLKCALPRHGFQLRVHDPDTVLHSAEAFDQRVLDVAVVWFDLHVGDDLSLLRLPTRSSGLGLVATTDLRHHAYNDSVWDALDKLKFHRPPTEQKPPSQRTASSLMYEVRLAELKEVASPAVLQLIELNALPGASRWLTACTSWMPAHCFAHVFRLKGHLASTRLASSAVCPGCPQLGPKSQKDFAIHVHGCTRVPHPHNATGAHNRLRDKLAKMGNDNAVPCSIEPKGYQKYTCGTCGAILEGPDVDKSVRTHDRSCKAKLYRSGVDVEGWLGHLHFLLDVTVAHLLCDTYRGKSAGNVVATKVAGKVAKYVGSGMIPAEEFRVGVAVSTGGFDPGLVVFLQHFAEAANLPFDGLVSDIANTVMWAQGASIEAAFKLAARARAIET